MNKPKYILLTNTDPQALQEAVNFKINEGYFFCGAPFAFGGSVAQAMTLPLFPVIEPNK